MPKILVVNECHLQKEPDGRCWSSGIVDYSIFSRPLSVFDEVLLAIRVREVEQRDKEYVHLCSGKGVDILPLPDYSGISGFIKNILHMNRIVKDYCNLADCALVRTPSAISGQFLKHINGKIPYAIEVSGDPWVWMAPGEYKSLFRPIIRRLLTNGLKKNCMRANGVSYVTEHTLQNRYPCRAILEGENKKYFTEHYSTVSISSEKKYSPKTYTYEKRNCKLIHIANAFTTYGKGHKESMEIVRRLNEDGLDVSIDFVGDGPLKKEFKQYARDIGIEDKVRFVGRINNKEDVYSALRNADIFLFPTHSEGLPRVVIESMYVGTPCVSTSVGGIPELLEESCLTEVGDVNSMYLKVRELLLHPKKLNKLSEYGIKKAQEYTDDVLQRRRNHFYQKLKDLVVS